MSKTKDQCALPGELPESSPAAMLEFHPVNKRAASVYLLEWEGAP